METIERNKKPDWHKLIASATAIVMAVAAVITLYLTGPKTEPTKTEVARAEPSKEEPPKTELPKTEPPKTEPPKTEPIQPEPPPPALSGRWNGRPKAQSFPSPTGTVPTEAFETYEFNSRNELKYSARMVFHLNPTTSVVCSGVARGKWSVASSTLTINFTEDLYVAVERAVESGVPLNGALAESKGYRCPDMAMIPKGFAVENRIVDVSDTTLRLRAVNPQGQAVISVFDRSLQ